jgi:hypothetical protein
MLSLDQELVRQRVINSNSCRSERATQSSQVNCSTKQIHTLIWVCFSATALGREYPLGFGLCESSNFSLPGKCLKLRPHYSQEEESVNNVFS